MKMQTRQFTAIFKKTGTWYSAWIEEIPGVNTQGKTLAEARGNLQEALGLILESNKIIALQNVGKGKVLREAILI